MRKSKVFAACAALMLAVGMTSCLDSGDTKQNYNYNLPAYALATNAEGQTSVTTGMLVNVNMDMVKSTAVVKFSGINLGGANATLTTREMDLKGGSYLVLGRKYAPIFVMEGKDVTGEDSGSITDFGFNMTGATTAISDSLMNALKDQLASDKLEVPAVTSYGVFYAISKFTTGDYQVRTFWNDLLCVGSGTTVTNGITYNTKTGVMRVKLLFEQGSEYKANVYFYNYKFKDEEGNGNNFMFAGVPVTYSASGFDITLTDATPVTLDGKSAAEDFKMNSLRVVSRDNMTGIEANYNLAGDEGSQGTFAGTGLYTFKTGTAK